MASGGGGEENDAGPAFVLGSGRQEDLCADLKGARRSKATPSNVLNPFLPPHFKTRGFRVGGRAGVGKWSQPSNLVLLQDPSPCFRPLPRPQTSATKKSAHGVWREAVLRRRTKSLPAAAMSTQSNRCGRSHASSVDFFTRGLSLTEARGWGAGGVAYEPRTIRLRQGRCRELPLPHSARGEREKSAPNPREGAVS